MTYKIKKSYMRILAVLIGFFSYGIFLLITIDTSTFGLEQFGLYLLITIPLLVILDIITTLIFDLATHFAIREEMPSEKTDVDRLEEYKSALNALYTFLFGIFLSALLLWITANLYIFFIVIFVTIHFTGIMFHLSYIKYETDKNIED